MTAPLSQNTGSSQPHPGQQQPPAASIAKTHPVLLAVTIGLGVAIIVVLGLMIGLTIKRATATDAAKPPPSGVPVPQTPAAGPQPAFNTLYVREGTSVAEARIDDGLLVVRTTGDAADEVMIFDPKTAQIVSRITLKKSDEP
jgi:hypothetical protein